jgi:hypothetical protein
LSAGTGAGTSRTSSTSGGPKRVITAALIDERGYEERTAKFHAPRAWQRRRAGASFTTSYQASLGSQTGVAMAATRNDILQGTLALLVLKTLAARGPLHGYALTTQIQRVSNDLLRVEEGSGNAPPD